MDAEGDREVGGEALHRVDLQHVAPLGEACSLRVRLLAPRVEVVDALVPCLWVPEWPHRRAGDARRVVTLVEFDARDHAVARDQVDHLVASRVRLKQRLPVQDDAGDVLRQAGGLVTPLLVYT